MALKDLNTARLADQGIDIEIYHPGSGESLGIVFTMLGSDSQAYLDAEHKIRGRQLEQAKRKRDFTVGMEPAQVEAAIIEKMTACFVGWKERLDDETYKDTICFEEGVELTASKEEFRKIISDRGFFWLRQQVQEGMDKVSNFLPNSASSFVSPPASGSSTTRPAKERS